MTRYRRQGSLYLPDHGIVRPDELRGFRGGFGVGRGFGHGSAASAPPRTAGEEGGGGEPFPTDVGAVNVISDTFESYADTADFLSDGSWGIELNPGADKIAIDPSEHYAGVQCLRFTLPTGVGSTPGPHIIRTLSTHSDGYAVSNFQVYLKASGDWESGKGIIMHNSGIEGTARSCGGTYYRYQIGFNQYASDSWGQNYSYPRLFPKGEDDGAEGGCESPINYTDVVTTNPYGGFVWTGRADDFDCAPLVSTDPDIANAPWAGLDDGNWHRFTLSVRQGSGLGGWMKMWLDGYPLYDSEGNANGYAMRPLTFEWEWLAAFGRTVERYIWIDNNSFWQEA